MKWGGIPLEVRGERNLEMGISRAGQMVGEFSGTPQCRTDGGSEKGERRGERLE